MKYDKIKDIYVCLTVFHLYVSIINILKEDKKDVLIILTDNIVNVENIKKQLIDIVPFLKIEILYNLKYKKKIIASIFNKLKWYIIIEAEIIQFLDEYDNILKKNTINIFNDTEYISSFLLRRYNSFRLWEDGLIWMIKRTKYDLKSLLKKFIFTIPFTYARDNKIIQILVKNKETLPQYLQFKAKQIEQNDLFSLSSDNINTIKNIFLPSLELPKSNEEKIVILTQPISEENYVTEEQKIKIYKDIILKYRQSYKIYIKNHPRDLTDYKKYINDIVVIPNNIPFEVFELSKDLYFQIGITLWSNAIKDVSFIKEKIFLGTDYIKDISMRKDF